MLASAATQGATIAGALLAIVTLVIAVGTAFVVQSRTSGMSTSLGIMETANAGLRDVVEDLKSELAASEATCADQLHAQEVSYTGQIQKLEGKLDLLTGDLAERLVAAAITAAQKAKD